MFYIIALIILLVAIIFVYIYRVSATYVAAHRAHRAVRRDPESQTGEVAKRPSFRTVAREVTHTMFPPREQNPHVPAHRRGSAEVARSSWSSGATAVHRVETRDGELPSYQDSAHMPKPPAPIYIASTSLPTAGMTGDQVPVPGYGTGAPPQYYEQPRI